MSPKNITGVKADRFIGIILKFAFLIIEVRYGDNIIK